MNKEILKKILRRNNIPDHYYNVDEKGGTDLKVCMKKESDRWKVYFSERGREFDVEYFDSESEACKHILTRFFHIK